MDETKAMFAAIIERLDVLIESFQSPKEDVQILKEDKNDMNKNYKK